MNFISIQEVENYAAERAVILTPADREKIALIQSSELKRLKALANGQERWADRWNRFYPRFLAAIVSLGDTLLTAAQTVIVSLGVPLVLVLLLIVEHQRVLHGIMLFESSRAMASFAAAALVLLNLTLEFQCHHVEHRAGYQAGRDKRFSLRLWLADAGYWLGLGDEWSPREHSPAQRYRRLLRLVTFTILALALAGSMRVVIEQTQGTWYEALQAIFLESSLLAMMTWAGGLLFAAAAVLSAQGLSRYVAIRCVEILATMTPVTETEYHRELDAAGARAALALVNEKLARRTARANPTQPLPGQPTAAIPIPMSMNGHSEMESFHTG